MKRLIPAAVFILILGALETHAEERGISGDVSGTWTTGEEIIVDGDIRVPPGRELYIEQGVLVRFTGRYKFIVQGAIFAHGVFHDPIVLTRAYPTEESKWRGFRFESSEPSFLEYCRIEWAKGDGAYPEVRGGGVWIDNCSPTIRYCTFTDNYSHNSNSNGAGGGICCNENCFSLIEYNHLFDNKADSGAGILVGWGCDPVIQYNLIEDNQAFYAGGGIYVSANAESTICGNVIRHNHSGGWGGGGINLWSATWLYGTYSHVFNNFVVDNTATDAGGGIYSRYETSILYQNTVAGNQANRGGGLYVLTYPDIPPEVYNSILWGNNAGNGAQVFLDPVAGSHAEITFCDVEDGWPGTGNIDLDPLFVDVSDEDYHLTYPSPCWNAGSTGVAMMPDEDFEGDPRIALEGVDMGADEFHRHLYMTGDFMPGGAVKGKITGIPGSSPVGLFLGTGIAEPPQPSAFGLWYLLPPLVGPIALPPLPASGVQVLPSTLPASPAGPYRVPMQTIVIDTLTNLFVLEVE
ncbi:MAG: right-handed parallel beta-helix repeat-containing protein [Planctomycetota bacterium]|jgi:parallel beta-helix repeat protein